MQCYASKCMTQIRSCCRRPSGAQCIAESDCSRQLLLSRCTQLDPQEQGYSAACRLR